MPTIKVYVWNGKEYDLSRWISLAHRGSGSCVLQLSDVCQPGKPSRLTSVSCPIGYLKSALDHGVVQVSLGTGHLLLQEADDVVHIEFRGKEDTFSVKAAFQADDFNEKLASLEEEAANLALSVSV